MLLLSSIVGFCGTILFIYFFRVPAIRYGIVDIPGGRKQHKGAIPIIGGSAIFFGYALAILFSDQAFSNYKPVLIGMTLLLVFGLLDDLREISAKQKLILQIASAILLVIWSEYRIREIGDIFGLGNIYLGYFSVPFTVICIVGYVNAINMIDGVDGLAGSVILSHILMLILAAYLSDVHENAHLILLASSVLGFLVFNFPLKNKSAMVFLGDSGSMMLGFGVAAFSIDLAIRAKGELPPIVIAAILAMPVFDAVILMARRIMKGYSPFLPDREHLHHILERVGISKTTSVYAMLTLSILPGLMSIWLWKTDFPEWLVTVILFLFLITHIYMVFRAWRFTRLIHTIFPN